MLKRTWPLTILDAVSQLLLNSNLLPASYGIISETQHRLREVEE